MTKGEKMTYFDAKLIAKYPTQYKPNMWLQASELLRAPIYLEQGDADDAAFLAERFRMDQAKRQGIAPDLTKIQFIDHDPLLLRRIGTSSTDECGELTIYLHKRQHDPIIKMPDERLVHITWFRLITEAIDFWKADIVKQSEKKEGARHDKND